MAYVVVCAGFGYRYYHAYGQWPHGDSRPDATEVHFPALDAAVFYLLMAQFVTVPLCLALLAAIRVKKVPGVRLARLYAWTALGAALLTTSGSFMSWYFD